MLNKITILFVISIIFSGCSHTLNINYFNNPDEYFEEINNKCDGKIAEITFLNGEQRKGSNITIINDTLVFLETKTDKNFKYPIDVISYIKVKNRTAGLFQGFLWGVLSGFVIGAIICLKDGKTTETTNGDITGRILSGEILGIIAGPSAGAIIGSNITFIINKEIKK